MPAAIITTFFMMYCPSSVGTKKPLHVSCGSKKSGPNVVTIWINRSGITARSAPLIKNSIPIRHSKRPKKIRNIWKLTYGIDLSKSRSTRPLAGLNPRTLRRPNQKNTTNKPIRATGMLIFRKKRIRARSNDWTDICINNTPKQVGCIDSRRANLIDTIT